MCYKGCIGAALLVYSAILSLTPANVVKDVSLSMPLSQTFGLSLIHLQGDLCQHGGLPHLPSQQPVT